jgi:AcrR family transcriptional regulator
MPRVRTARRIVAERFENDRTVGLRERKKARLRQQIIDTSIKLFRKRGFENTRIDDIVQVLEISQPTFFRYFSSKDAVLREVGERGFACTRDRLRSELSSDASTAERLRRLYVSMAKEVEADRSLWQAVVLSGAMDPVRCANVRGHEEATVGLLREILVQGQKRGEITHDFPVVHLAEFMEGLYNTVVRQEKRRQRQNCLAAQGSISQHGDTPSPVWKRCQRGHRRVRLSPPVDGVASSY